jgi:restriction system protein
MPVPTYDKFIEPILRHLAAHPDGLPAAQVHEAAADALGISAADRLELLPSGTQPVYKNRAGWAHDRLKRKELSGSPRPRFWRLTELGIIYAREHPAPLSDAEVKDLALSSVKVRLRQREANAGARQSASPPVEVVSPDDRLEAAVAELRGATAEELLDTIRGSSPTFFERLVLDLLHAMGYGATRADLQHVGRSNDGGIDGIISLDRLGLEKVFVQAKRWNNPVGREMLQAFVGALSGQRATKGVFITTSTFTSQAIDYVRSIEKSVVLIDGIRLAELLMDYGVGVSHRAVKIPKLDSDYFDE